MNGKKRSISWEPYWARGIKFSSITTKSCPKLSSKHKRLILKNCKEK
ncbi:MAG: hypothetical protein MSA09_02975 [Lachnospiraceae bacterium]|nr:hypothetical protein [Lachnospiraceae bacterium]MDD7178653.1 hypothetical protein [bacterium]MDY5516659.1 hypothetical protein [Lachnospiraceae bacterium]